jgi:hypothetical protein
VDFGDVEIVWAAGGKDEPRLKGIS